MPAAVGTLIAAFSLAAGPTGLIAVAALLAEGVLLEERVAGDLDQIEMQELEWIADRRMMRAVLRGDAAEALRWRRVYTFLAAEAREIERLVAAEEAMGRVRREAHDVNGVNGVNGVFGPGA